MNKIQRFLLIFFAVLILFSSSYTQQSDFLKLFLVAILLFFGISPKGWYHHIESPRKEPKEGLDEDCIEDDDPSLPVLGFPNQELDLILKSLIKLRSAEIGSIYLTLRSYQRQAGEGNWVSLFMKEMAVSGLYYDPYINIEEKKEKQTENEAEEIFEKKYKFCSFAPIELYEDEIADLRVALGYSRANPQLIIHRLEEIKSFGILSNLINSLIKEYRLLNKVSAAGDFGKVFNKNKTSSSFKYILDRIASLWYQISRIIKVSLMVNRISENIENEKPSNRDIDLKEIEALLELEMHLGSAIIQENSNIKNLITFPSNEQESFFLERLKFNPFWYKYF